jgi:UDP-N-acetylmuramate dehydrogenase
MEPDYKIPEHVIETLSNKWGDRLILDASLAGHTLLAIGGPVRLLLEVESEADMVAIYADIMTHHIPYFLLGEGSNVLVDDNGIEGIVLVNKIKTLPCFDNERVEAVAGSNLHEIVTDCTKAGLLGLEFAAGIPGTVGGAIYGNAGAFGKAIGDRIIHVRLLNCKGEVEERARGAMEFGYRTSILKQTGEIVLSCLLQLERGDAAAGLQEIEKNLALRAEKHPEEGTQTAGSYFKNVKPVSSAPRRQAAGYYLEQVGAKELRVGGAGMYGGHANILVNYGNATAADVLALTKELQKRVFDKFSIQLEPEVMHLTQDRLHHTGE